MLLHSFGMAWVCLAFKINQDQIARTLCVNRYKPVTLCSGKCVLQQRLRTEDEKGCKELPQKLKDRLEASCYLGELSFEFENTADFPPNQAKNFAYQTPFTVAVVNGVFRPPNRAAAFSS